MINIAELLKDVPKGIKLYSPLFGEVEFSHVTNSRNMVIYVSTPQGFKPFTSDGNAIVEYIEGVMMASQECLLFPSKDCRTWEGWKAPVEPKFKVGDTIRDIVNNENRTYMIIGINYGTKHYLVNGGSISFFVQDSYEVVETDDQIWLREACDYLYKHLFTKADGAEHYVVSCQKITQTEFVQYFCNHMKEVMK